MFIKQGAKELRKNSYVFEAIVAYLEMWYAFRWLQGGLGCSNIMSSKFVIGARDGQS